MHLEEIWRYPVKSMAGERLEESWLGAGGVPGDRLVQVRRPGAAVPPGEPPRAAHAGWRMVTARSAPHLLGHRAVLGADGEPLVDGRKWNDDAVAADVERAAGPGARLVRSAEPGDRFDILPLLVMTDGAIAAVSMASLAGGSLELDRRRFRPNLLIGGVAGLAERSWEGRRLRVGEAIVALDDLRGRCVMTTFDPDDLAQEPRVMRTLVETVGGLLGLNADVERAGRIRVGDPVELL
ncbi:MAG: MOSC domain-containing protein [Thermoanaerobaculia bacterium]